ncbi:MAG: acylneuraminate cytidylyltransferase family protein [Balneolaceae bacterium]
MVNGKRVLIIIPARGGSKGVPGKNIKKLRGKPLISYTIDAAREVLEDEYICLSTDSKEIKELAESIGLEVPFIRPSELAQDTSGTYEVLIHALDFYEQKGVSFDIVVLLQPTSPLRTKAHIKEALELYSDDLDMVVSVKETSANPYYVLFEEDSMGFLKKSKKGDFIRRQDCPRVWEYNGAIYIINVVSLRKKKLHQFERIRKYVMDDFHSIDIDTKLDFEIADYLISKRT